MHASSIGFAAVRGDELLEERTLAYDLELVESVCAAGLVGVVAMKRGRPASTFTAAWRSVGSPARWSRRGWCRSGRVIGSRPGSRDARKLARLDAGGLLEPIYVPSRELEAARDLIRAR